MRLTRTTIFGLLLAATGAAQVNPEIEGYELSPNGELINPSGYSTVLDNDDLKYFRVRMDLGEEEYAFVFARLWVEPAVIAGTAVGTAVVETMQATHHNLQVPATCAAHEVVLPGGYELDPECEQNQLQIERERLTDFLIQVAALEQPELLGFKGDSSGTWTLHEPQEVPTAEEDERWAWSPAHIWSRTSVPDVGHVSQLVHHTFEQGLYQYYGAEIGNNLQAISALSSFINENVVANVAIHVVVVDKREGQKKIKIKIPVVIRRRSLKQIDDPVKFLTEGVPTWFPTALFSAIHVAEAGSTMTVPMKFPTTAARLVWACSQGPCAPFLILDQTFASYGTNRPTFVIPATIVSDLAEYEPLFPFGYVLDSENNPLIPTYNWGGAGGIVTYPIDNKSQPKD
ncbi:MAG: hypothetical protein H6832_18745 [Planctomycetes bacterium]|nr:hypothetical protein [Planctomycetota bacterium]MCB9920448.1 hypothetical protein [Planctomycetota bacterium]